MNSVKRYNGKCDLGLFICIIIILIISIISIIVIIHLPGNREPWNLWSYGGRELKKRSTEVEKELTELEVRGKKKNKPLLSIQTQDGGMIYATNTRRVDVTDAVALDVS